MHHNHINSSLVQVLQKWSLMSLTESPSHPWATHKTQLNTPHSTCACVRVPWGHGTDTTGFLLQCSSQTITGPSQASGRCIKMQGRPHDALMVTCTVGAPHLQESALGLSPPKTSTKTCPFAPGVTTLKTKALFVLLSKVGKVLPPGARTRASLLSPHTDRYRAKGGCKRGVAAHATGSQLCHQATPC